MGQPASKWGHAEYEPYENLHSSVGSYDGGKCLARHQSQYKQRDSCSHRWQAVKRAFGEDKDIYNSHDKKNKRLNNTGFSTPLATTAGSYQRVKALADKINKEDIFIAKSGKHEGRSVVTVEAKAFRTAFAPYGNQAHHLLPDAELRHGIVEITNPAPQVKDVICQGLLDAKYNLNHWENMMILPTRREDGCAIDLPTHPNQHYHQDYSAKLKDRVILALAPYRSVVDAAANKKKEHPNPDPQNIKRRLESISKTIHRQIVLNVDNIKNKKEEQGDITVNSLAAQVARWLGV